jgi:hypothetical protein
MNSGGVQIEVGDRVQVFLDSRYWRQTGWFAGTVIRIDPYSAHRRFHWVELDLEVQATAGGETRLVSVLNPRHIQYLQEGSDSTTT